MHCFVLLRHFVSLRHFCLAQTFWLAEALFIRLYMTSCWRTSLPLRYLIVLLMHCFVLLIHFVSLRHFYEIIFDVLRCTVLSCSETLSCWSTFYEIVYDVLMRHLSSAEAPYSSTDALCCLALSLCLAEALFMRLYIASCWCTSLYYWGTL